MHIELGSPADNSRPLLRIKQLFIDAGQHPLQAT
jgi:hypothetical protein